MQLSLDSSGFLHRMYKCLVWYHFLVHPQPVFSPKCETRKFRNRVKKEVTLDFLSSCNLHVIRYKLEVVILNMTVVNFLLSKVS